MPEIDLRPGFFMFAIVLAALDRSGSVLPILYAMGVHELAHVVMMLACGGRVRRLTLRFADLRIDAAGLGYRQELLAALAGPLDRKSTRLNSSHSGESRMPSSA